MLTLSLLHLLAAITIPPMVLAIITGLAPLIQTYLTSFIVKLANTGKGFLAGKPDIIVRLALAAVGILVSYGGQFLGWVVTSDPVQWTAATAQGLAQALVAAGIYQLGKMTTPSTTG